MYSVDDLASVHGFLRSTPEAHLKKMMCFGDFSEVHFKLVLKLARGCSEDDFVQAATNDSFATLRLNASELQLKETFWPSCFKKWLGMGLIQAAKAAA